MMKIIQKTAGHSHIPKPTIVSVSAPVLHIYDKKTGIWIQTNCADVCIFEKDTQHPKAGTGRMQSSFLILLPCFLLLSYINFYLIQIAYSSSWIAFTQSSPFLVHCGKFYAGLKKVYQCVGIPHICYFLYTGKIFQVKILHPKARKLRQIEFRDKIA